MRLRFELDTGKAEEQPPVTVVNNAPPPEREATIPLAEPRRAEAIAAEAGLILAEPPKEAAWAKVREGRQKWLDGVPDEDIVANDKRNHWIGGALAIWCEFTGEDPAVAHNRLLKEMPQPGHDNSMLAPGELPLQAVSRPRAEPHPGAQRVVDEDDPTMEPAESEIPEYVPDDDESLAQGGIVDATDLAIIGEDATEEDVDEDVRSAMLQGVAAASNADPVDPLPKPEKATPAEVSITKIEDRS